MKIFFIIIASLFLPLTRLFAHEEGATSVTPDNITGPILALIIIVLAVVAAKRIKPRRPKGSGSRPNASGNIKNHYD